MNENEHMVTVEIEGGRKYTYTDGRSWQLDELSAALHVLAEQGDLIATHRGWTSVRLDDAPGGVSAA